MTQILNRAQPLVSVIIPTKDRGNLLFRAIKSVDEQKYRNVELIVVDDASVNPVSYDKIKQYCQNKSLKLIRNDYSQGGGQSRNIGFNSSSGEYICFLDDDDVYFSNKINILLEKLQNNPIYHVAFGRVLLNDGKNKRHPVIYPVKFDSNFNFLIGNYIHTNSTLIKRDAFANTLFNADLPKYQDTQLHLELSLKYKILFIDEDVAEWSVDGRPDQITFLNSNQSKLKSYNSFIKLKSYFENDLKANKLQLAYFDYYSSILEMRTKKNKWYLIFLQFFSHPIYTSKIIILRKKFLR
jgi:glycosyltransferase involved in cell wall biosynthesis